MKIILIIVVVLVLWSVWGYFGSRVEQAQYTVIRSAKGYEVRTYPAHIVAQTTVTGVYRDAMNQGFRIVAGYIFGGNARKESIAMTAPVTQQELSTSQRIAMTAPVFVGMKGDTHTISFGMPSTYTMETLPTPTDSRVTLVTVSEKTYAVMKFSWYRTDARVKAKQSALIRALQRDSVEVIGNPQYAGYNAPWTPPWMMRNEVMIEVKSS